MSRKMDEWEYCFGVKCKSSDMPATLAFDRSVRPYFAKAVSV